METTGFEGYIDAEVRDGRLDVAAPVAAHIELEVERLKTGNSLYDYELERRLEVRRYPLIRGDVREVRLDGNTFHVRGDLSFHGKTCAVEGDVTVKVVDETTIVVEGEKVFDIRDFGLEPPKILMLRVYPDVRVRARVVAQRE